MLFDDNSRIIMAGRLKCLRQNYKGTKLSHEKLTEMLNEQYYKKDGFFLKRTETEIEEYRKKIKISDFGSENSEDNNKTGKEKKNPNNIISKSVLLNYEVDHVNNSKYKTAFGMNISYISMLADFYGVSVDYLLGFTELSSPDEDSRSIYEKTSLSEDAIETLLYFANLEITRKQLFYLHGRNTNLIDKKVNSPKIRVSNIISKYLSSHNFKTVLMCLSDLIVSIESLKDGRMKSNRAGKTMPGVYDKADRTFAMKYLTYEHYADIWIKEVAENFIGKAGFDMKDIFEVGDVEKHWRINKLFEDMYLKQNASEDNTDMPTPDNQDSED